MSSKAVKVAETVAEHVVDAVSDIATVRRFSPKKIAVLVGVTAASVAIVSFVFIKTRGKSIEVEVVETPHEEKVALKH